MSNEHSGSGGKVSTAEVRREGFRIIPLCPFAKAQFERHAEWRDVLSS
jgi:predicted GNAT family acetyltransferase